MHSEWGRTVKAGEHRVAMTGLLASFAAAYLMGIGLVYRDNHLADGEPALSVRDLRIRFTMDAKSLLEARVRGDMRQYLGDSGELAAILDWLRAGAPEEGYRQATAAIFDERCVRCHHAGGQASFRPLVSYPAVAAAAVAPPAPSFSHQLLVTKVHVAGIAVMVGIAAVAFGGAPVAPWLRGFLPFAAFLGLACDFGSWWLMRLDPGFAWGRLAGNALLTGSLLAMIAGGIWAQWRTQRTDGTTDGSS